MSVSSVKAECTLNIIHYKHTLSESNNKPDIIMGNLYKLISMKYKNYFQRIK